ncbi:hypothetical protein Cni_G22229 [Canna indica]|uniref:Aminotransferase class I/classII large domain-containing protein n=1 Tax=Canna indica TaxID=4628 RepID=A0AAQ3KS42_9LILI|nr:hypothetical protein Cni_G22229 [Canna indica]
MVYQSGAAGDARPSVSWLGTAIARPILDKLLDFTTEKNIHLISDEIYSSFIFSSDEFVSMAEIIEAQEHRRYERVHIVYNLPKDLDLLGFRVGAMYSYNDATVTTVRQMSSFTLVSSQMQKTLAVMLGNR